MVTIGTDLSTASVQSLLREMYTDGVEDFNVNDCFVYNGLSTAPESFTGLQLTGAVGIGRSSALQGQPQINAMYPAPGARSTLKWSIPACVTTGSRGIDEIAAALTQDEGAFESAATEDYMSWMENYADEKERKVMGNGSGCLNIHGGIARIPGGGALDTTVAGWQFAVSIFDHRKFRKDLRVNFMNVTTAINSTTWRAGTLLTTTPLGYSTIRSVQPDTANNVCIITMNEPLTGGTLPTAAGEFGNASNLTFVIAAGSVLGGQHTDGSNLGTEMMGIDGIVNGSNGLGVGVAYSETGQQWLQVSASFAPYTNGTFQNLSPVTTPEWQSQVMAVRALDTTLNQTILDQSVLLQNMFGTQGSSGWKWWIFHPMQIQAYARSIQAKERYNISANTPSSLPTGRGSLNQRAGQGEAMEHAGRPMYGSTMCRADCGYAISDDSCEKAIAKSFSFRNDGLSNDGRTMEVEKGFELDNLLTRNRKKATRVDGLKLPTFSI